MPIKPLRMTIPQLVEKFQQFPAGAVVTNVTAEGGEPTWEWSSVRRCTYVIEVEILAGAAKPTKEGEKTANRELIERLAREEGMTQWTDHAGVTKWYVDEAKLPDVVARIAEACAKVADDCDKSVHPAEIADRIRSKFSKG